jgi:Ca2+-binding EF-hand superfamily protein
MSAALLAVAFSYVIGPSPQPLRACRNHPCGRCARIVAEGALPADDVPDMTPGGGLIRAEDRDLLSSRIQKIQEQGGAVATPAQKLFELATEKPPQLVLREFFMTAPEEVSAAMRDAVVSLLGTLPPMQFDAQISSTADKLAAMMLQLQMTGYMLRNAEYVTTLRRLLNLQEHTQDDLKEAFDKLDLDGSGYIETAEVEELLTGLYGGKAPPDFEVKSFITFFDANKDGRVSCAAQIRGAQFAARNSPRNSPRTSRRNSGRHALRNSLTPRPATRRSFEEFVAALGPAAERRPGVLGALAAAADDGAIGPELSGQVTVEMDDGSTVEMDAAEYMAELKQEAQALRAELAKMENVDAGGEPGSSLTAYVSGLPKPQLQALTSGITEDVVGAMQMLVRYILTGSDGKQRQLDDTSPLTIEQEKLQQLCLYQLVLGYRLREAEAKGEAQKLIGS